MKRLRIQSGQGKYDVLFAREIKQALALIASPVHHVIYADRKVAALHAGPLRALTRGRPTLVVDATEQEKTLAGVTRLLDLLRRESCTRQSQVVAVGGGIVQDVAAFSAHVYHRGLQWLFLPTTLLAMGDSCIGAKCGINFGERKNQLGVFHAPSRIVVCDAFLKTLTDEAMRSGYGEILKLSLTGPSPWFEELSADLDRHGIRGPNILRHVQRSLAVKKTVIERDEYERDLRRILNYGHTFGHALETLTSYAVPHGLAVAWGVDLANFIAMRRGMLTEGAFTSIHDVVKRHFPCPIAGPVDAASLVELTRADKKVANGKLMLILPERLGKLKIVGVPFDSALEAVVSDYLARFHVAGRA